MSIVKITDSSEETLCFAREFARQLKSPSVILLSGDLGAGKTTFVRGFVSNWGMEKLVSSPTFTLLNHYTNDYINIYHFDLYRLNHSSELDELGLEDFITKGDYTLIEWPEIASNLLNFPVISVKITFGENLNQRQFEIEGVKIGQNTVRSNWR